jgi:membrane protease YdiL (CAAX protease family)
VNHPPPLPPVGPAGWLHLGLFGVLLTLAAFRSRSRLAIAPLPPLPGHLRSVLVQQVAFATISLLIARREWIPLHPDARPSSAAVGLGILVLGAMIACMRPRWRKAVLERKRVLALVMPRTPAEKRLWAAISLAAGIGEEITYRGVMFVLLWRLTGSGWAAALVGASVFGLGHIMQGWAGVAVTTAFGLAFQGLAAMSGSLLVPMAVHVLYDLTAGFSYARLGRELGYPEEGNEAGAASGAPPT